MKGKIEPDKNLFCVPIETTFEVELPPEVLKVLDLHTGDSVYFQFDDNGQVYLKKHTG